MNEVMKFAVKVAIGASVCSSAFAQSSVTLYGIVDQSIRYTNNANASNGSEVQLTNGAISNSRWGLQGTEDLGGGLQAIFKLENGFEPQNGQMDSNAIFGRYAYVGFASNYGTVKLGRQLTEGFNLFVHFDPLTIGNYMATEWSYAPTLGRANNVVSYDETVRGLNFGASYGVGGQPGSLSANSYWGAHSAYAQGPLSIGAVYQETRDILSHTQQMWGAAVRYLAGPATFFLGYLGGRDATGIVDRAILNDPRRNVTYGSFVDNPRKDAVGYTGIVYQFDPALAFTGAFYYDSMQNVNGIDGNAGKRYTGVLLAQYSISKATQVYGTVDYNKVSGGAVTELPGASNQTGVAVGLRHIF